MGTANYHQLVPFFVTSCGFTSEKVTGVWVPNWKTHLTILFFYKPLALVSDIPYASTLQTTTSTPGLRWSYLAKLAYDKQRESLDQLTKLRLADIIKLTLANIISLQ